MATTALKPVGWTNGWKQPPANAIAVTSTQDFANKVAPYLVGGALDGDSADFVWPSGTFDEIGIETYVNSDGGSGLGLWGQPNGSTLIEYTGNGMAAANLCILRVGSPSNQFLPNDGITICNFDFHGRGIVGDLDAGSIWGVVVGGAFAGDPRRSNSSNVTIRGCRVREQRQQGFRFDGNGNTRDCLLEFCTSQDSGRRYQLGNGGNQGGNPGAIGSGEGIYLGDGNSGRTYFNIIVRNCHVFDIRGGEGIEAKQNGNGVQIVDNYVHDVLMDNGGGIKNIANNTLVEGNRVHRVTVNADSDSGSGNAYQLLRTTRFYNNVGWDCDAIVSVPTGPAGQTIDARHNTFDATGTTIAVWKSNQDGTSTGTSLITVNSRNNVYVGDIIDGTTSNFTFADYTATAADFVGPTATGAADAGDGPGSGYCLQLTSNAVDAAPNILPVDISDFARPFNGSSDFGAFEISDDEPVILANDLYGGTVGQAFSANALFNDPNLGDPTTVCSPISGTLPPGLIWNNGILSGTPTAAGTFTIQYQCVDSDGDSDTATIQFFIEDAPVTGGGQLRCILT